MKQLISKWFWSLLQFLVVGILGFAGVIVSTIYAHAVWSSVKWTWNLW